MIDLAPKLFSIAFALIKPFFNDRLKNKISIFGHDGWKAALLEDINPDQLPVCYGGTLEDPDGNPYYTTKVIAKLSPSVIFLPFSLSLIANDADLLRRHSSKIVLL